MNSGMVKTTIREIRGSFGRYMAILAIVMLGVSLFAGLKATTPAMIATENTYLAEQNFFDFRLLSTIGFTEENVNALKAFEEAADVEGTISVDVLCDFGEGNESAYKIHAVPEKINRIVLTAGRMPERADECVLDDALYGEEIIGSRITVTDNNEEDTLEMFCERTFTVVGLARSPLYINSERGTTSIGSGRLTAFLYVQKDAFDCDYLTEIYVTTKQKYDVYTEAYQEYTEALEDSIEVVTETLVQNRYDELLAEAQEKIDDAREELADIDEPDYYVLNRNTNIGYACYESDSNIVAAIANVFPLFFFLVAALICMTTMNRMVEEQRTQIGVLKALGYGNAAIMGKFLFYAGSAAAFGAFIGLAGGTWLFPRVIWTGYGIMYNLGEIEYYFDVPVAVLSLAAALLCSMGAAHASCRYELYSVPASLIRPKAPKSGKRIFLERVTFIWRRLKFLQKVSVRNLVRYKKRFFMMILGISGCTALLVTGFGVKDSVADIAGMQYDEIQIFDIGITFSDGVQGADMDALMEQTGGMLEQAACRYEESVDLDFGGKTKSTYLVIPENVEEIMTFLNLHTPDGEPIPYPADGEAVLSGKLAENLGIRAGDRVTLRDNDMNSLTVTVSALCENFVYSYVYISKGTYMEQLGREPEYRSAYAIVKEDADIHEAAAAVSDRNNVLAVSVTQDMRERIGSMMGSMDYIVFLIIVCAGSLAFIVLYNLTNINITERIREIATIKVLGFYAKETADYVFRENLFLTGMGAVVGLGLGKLLHWFVMYNINLDMVSFKTLIMPASYLWSFVLTFAFAMFVNGLMFFKLEKINMAESLKSIE